MTFLLAPTNPQIFFEHLKLFFRLFSMIFTSSFDEWHMFGALQDLHLVSKLYHKTHNNNDLWMSH
jgi:hypothetical protein